MRSVGAVALATCALLVALSSEAQTGKGLSPADVSKINESTQTMAKASLAKDWSTYAAQFLEDAVQLAPNEPEIKGRPAIRAWLDQLPPLELKLNNVKVEGRSDLAYVLGTYALTVTPPGAPEPVKDSGKYVEVRRKQADGRWLIAVTIWNSDIPVAPPPK